MFRGDTMTFSLSLPCKEEGKAWLRTNIGHAAAARREIIRHVCDDTPLRGKDWFDISMTRIDDLNFQVTIPLRDVGHFEAKCLFIKEGENSPIWPEGTNTVINVEPADTCCANTVYNAFVRQFGRNKNGIGAYSDLENECFRKLDDEGYAVIPPSGTFRELIKEIDFITGTLGCRYLHLLPVHPSPTTYARMGRFGSPYASLSFTAVDPALAEFDPGATPMEQFIELVDAVHARDAKIIIDFAANHTGWAARLHEIHPEWLKRDEKGCIIVPEAWGVKWEDLTSLDYSYKDLWQFMADVFLTWCGRGVDGFRCDAGYMIPVPVWKYIVAAVRDQFPNTLFFLEGLGGKISVTRDILNTAGFNWAYSELFQNYNRNQIEHYLPEVFTISAEDGIMVHFAETHDNNRLAARSKEYAGMRTAFCALSSHQGGFGFANGVEWFATEKINVHDSPSLNWGAEENQVAQIQRLNMLLRFHPAFFDKVELKLIQQGEGEYIVLLRHHVPSGKRLLIVINLDIDNRAQAAWSFKKTGINGNNFVDLLTGREVVVSASGDVRSCLLAPAQILCLTPDKEDVALVSVQEALPDGLPERIKHQLLRAKALDVFCYYNGTGDIGRFDPDQAAEYLADNPVEYCRSLNNVSSESRVVTWKWPRDVKREVMIPPDHFLMVCSDCSFRAEIIDDISNKKRVIAYETSLPSSSRAFFALFSPLAVTQSHRRYNLKITVYKKGAAEHVASSLLYLSSAENVQVQTTFKRSDILSSQLMLLHTNSRGGMLRSNIAWGNLNSKYDAILAANIHPEFPEDRRVLLPRCRAWLVYQGFSTEINTDCLTFFYYNQSGSFWEYIVPTGQGESVALVIGIEMSQDENAVRICFFRRPSENLEGKLDDCNKVQLILRPDIDDRSFHENTRAYLGPEESWAKNTKADSASFVFSPGQGHRLHVSISKGSFSCEPEWQYMVHLPADADRGMDDCSDLFSPGYFSAMMEGNETVELTAACVEMKMSDIQKNLFSSNLVSDIKNVTYNNYKGPDFGSALKQALTEYLVKRGNLKTVIAGYPWFLDWGRDSLIVTRGLIAAGMMEDARAVLKQFAYHEKYGTIPNMLLGNDTGNRDTSDAPLWLFVACNDLILADGSDRFLGEQCGSRSIRQILISIGNSFVKGTTNGIQFDPETGLIFSPAHFTWMDTDHPASTPRQGYCVEIQALWHAALILLSRIDRDQKDFWETTAAKVRQSIIDLFLLEDGYLSDCLHVYTPAGAVDAEIDDALRPNQLLAITLGAVTDTDICRGILDLCQGLLVPGALRSLSDRQVRRPLEIVHNGKRLNDPYKPYWGTYSGSEDTMRKPAYHNGTAWTWIFPSFCEAWAMVYGDKGKKTALSWLSSSIQLFSSGCINHIPEILDGDLPHQQRGCDAQAWGSSELFRVWKLLN